MATFADLSGNVFVRGKYKKSLTIGAANNIVIDGNVLSMPNTNGVPEGSPELGLIAENFVRVYHPVAQWDGAPSKFGTCPGGLRCGSGVATAPSTRARSRRGRA